MRARPCSGSSLFPARSSLPPRPSQDGKTALDLAKEKKHTEVVKLLENAPAIAAKVSAAPPSPLCTPPSLERGTVRPVLTPHPCGCSLTYLPFLQLYLFYHVLQPYLLYHVHML